MSADPTLYSFLPPKKGFLRLVSNSTSRGVFHTGEFIDRRGIVLIVRESWLTMLEVRAENGRVYRWTWEKELGNRTLYRVCRDMLTEFVGLEHARQWLRAHLDVDTGLEVDAAAQRR